MQNVTQNISLSVEAVKAELCRRSLFRFVQEFWDIIIPEDPVWNWHIEYLCGELQKVGIRLRDRQPKKSDIIINVPPGSTKSTICTVMFPAWLWAIDPTLRIITGSHTEPLAIDHALKSRDIIKSDKFRTMYPAIELRRDVDNKKHYKNSAGGERLVVTIGSAVTGFHAHIKIIDDPIKPLKNDNIPADIAKANNFISRTLSTRNVSKEITPLLLVMQRLHTNDPTGHILSNEAARVKHICLPATTEYEVKPAELKDNYVDGLLDPVRFSREALKQHRADLGTAEYTGQFGQAPVPAGGNIVKKEWFEVVNINDIPNELLSQPVNLYFDGAYTEDTKNDPSALLATVFYKNDLYLFDYWRDWKEFNGAMQIIHAKIERYCDARSVLFIETKAIGETVRQEMKRASYGIINLKGHNPKGSKETRLRGWAAKIEAGHIKVIKGAWNDHFIQYVCGFPAMPHDEEVDTLTMACGHNFNLITNNKNSRRWKSG